MNTPEGNTISTAELTLAMMLALSRKIPQAQMSLVAGVWDRKSFKGTELNRKVLGVIGLGRIGRAVARRAAAFGMRVLATDPKDRPFSRIVEYVGRPYELHALLPQADVIVVCAPRTPATEKMLSTTEFELMKKGVYIINVSRGALIDTDALVEALDSGRVRAAGLDVTEPEPLPAESALWERAEVFVMPHSSCVYDEYRDLHVEQLGEWLSGYL
jgi:D-3-phosphoglycerate dehydrogenase